MRTQFKFKLFFPCRPKGIYWYTLRSTNT